MSAAGRPERRQRSRLAAEHPAYPVPVPAAAEPAPTEAPPTRAPARTRDHGRDKAARVEQARARTAARDAAWGWAAAWRKAARRRAEWVRSMERARELGAEPDVLRGYLTEAAEQAGIDPAEIPAEVWRAAGLEPPHA